MHELEQPFYVLATQNPIELEGTYPLPEAQLDRFMMNIWIDYLTEDEELDVATRTTAIAAEEVEPVFTGEDMLDFCQAGEIGTRGRACGALCGATGAGEPPRRYGAGFCDFMGELGRGYEGRAGVVAGGKGAGAAQGAIPRFFWRYSSGCAQCVAPPHFDQF